MDILGTGIKAAVCFGGATLICAGALRGNSELVRKIVTSPGLIRKVLQEEGNLPYILSRGGNKFLNTNSPSRPAEEHPTKAPHHAAAAQQLDMAA